MNSFDKKTLETILVPHFTEERKRFFGRGVARLVRASHNNYSEFFLGTDSGLVYRGVNEVVPSNEKIPVGVLLVAPLGMTRIISSRHFENAAHHTWRHLVIEPADHSSGIPTPCHVVLQQWNGNTFDYKETTDLSFEYMQTRHADFDYKYPQKIEITTLDPIAYGRSLTDEEYSQNDELSDRFRDIIDVAYDVTFRPDNG